MSTGWIAAASALALLALARWVLRRGLTPAAEVPQDDPGARGLRGVQTVWLDAPRGRKLFAWFAPAQGVSRAPAVVLMHGWGGHAGHLLQAAVALQRAGYAVLLPEARNHGRSDRDDHSSLPRFAEDLGCALDWLKCQPEVDADRLAALGHSVGAAAVLLAASQRDDLRAVVSVSSFAHPEQVMRRWLAARRIPYWPLGWLVNRYVESVIGTRFARIAPETTLPQARCPVLLIHGRSDRTVPLDDAEQLFARRGTASVELLIVEGTHEQFDDEPALFDTVRAFLHKHLASAPLAAAHDARGTAHQPPPLPAASTPAFDPSSLTLQ
ncbi:serine aminopeptidase S33 family [Tibeticola sediminis]|uniref:Serine aminopeptidase S33 family n=1 Tax=Tibeticola sediminis TaxID=1917811 RepID=A0A3N4U7D6_9BURK|nr:alpha/beta fold hydrolase [Tibeticola sediminis]RPE62859.1 serine aminopeptidase S33 family [Tibeticola sediminis]